MGRCIALLAATSLMLTGVAWADTRVFHDGDEEPFCETDPDCLDTDFMDFRRISHGHSRNPRVVQHSIRTAKRWKTRKLGGRHGLTIYIELALDNDDYREDHLIRIRRKHGRLWAGMSTGPDFEESLGPVRVWRPNRHSVKVGFSADLLEEGITSYRWSADWGWRNFICSGSRCGGDRAPDRGRLLHRL